MRHGTTVWNEKKIIQGHSHNRLSKAGTLLVQARAKELQDVPLDIIVTSPLTRTRQTARIMNQYHQVKIVPDAALLEIGQGIFTGRSKLHLTLDEQVLRQNRTGAGMETYPACFARVKVFVAQLKEKYPYENVLVVTHEGVATFIEDILTNAKVDFANAKFIRNFANAAVKKFVL